MVRRPEDNDRVLTTSDHEGLEEILRSDVVAVFLLLQKRLAWLDELSEAVDRSTFVVPRTILADATLDEVARSVTSLLENSCLSHTTREALLDDVVQLVKRCGDLTRAKRFRFRFFTDRPNCRCSYHVDFVPPRAPTTALVRVYCGSRTEYVPPENLTCWEDFYAYAHYRQKHTDAVAAARNRNDSEAEQVAQSRLNQLDSQPPFLVKPLEPETVPPDTLVACKFVDSHYVWGCAYIHARSARGWIHRSPMKGSARFVATVNSVR